jgi:hypothetical protein
MICHWIKCKLSAPAIGHLNHGFPEHGVNGPLFAGILSFHDRAEPDLRQSSFRSDVREACVGGRQYRALPVPICVPGYTCSPAHLQLPLCSSMGLVVRGVTSEVWLRLLDLEC